MQWQDVLLPHWATFGLQWHPVATSFLCSPHMLPLYKPSANPSNTDIIYLFKAADVAAEYLSTWMSLDHDLPFLLRFGGKIQSSFHRFTPAKWQPILIHKLQANHYTVLFSHLQRLLSFTSPGPASSACGHQSRNGCQWQCSWGRPH